ncbi:MAG: hypothetical protein VKM01_00465 [Cyanobacteriota bacterium]|jgi:hypothetical protein|nr:hypothetical protein [Cyanobacteriota bacterium]
MGSPISRETFLERAQARFADAYDYSEIVYKSYKTPVNIRCRIHPVKLISITPEKHLQTSGGCKFCLRQSRIRMLERELHRDSVEGASLGKDLVERVMFSSSGCAGLGGAGEGQPAPLH